MSTSIYVVAEAGQGTYAFAVERVREMVSLPAVTAVPGVPHWVRGVMNLRGRVLPVIDLCERLHTASAASESEALAQLLTDREHDHVRWMDTLEQCVRDEQPFGLPRDPTQCACGKWLASFHTENLMLASELRKFDAPHRQVHALADVVLGLAAEGRQEDALHRIGEARQTVLARLRNHFRQARDLLTSRREVAVVLDEEEAGLCAVVLDRVDAVGALEAEPLPQQLAEGLRDELALTGVAKHPSDGRLVLLLGQLGEAGLAAS